MSTFVAFTRLDIGNLARQPRQYLLAVVFVVVIAAVSPLPALALAAAGVMVSVLTLTPFALDERGRLDTLYGVLPTSRATVVLGRFVSTMTLWAALSAVAALAAVVGPVLRDRPLQAELLAPMLVVGFAVAAVSVSVQLPVFFAVGHTRGRPIAYVPVVLIAGATFVAGRFGLLPASTPEAGVLAVAAAIVVVGGIVLLVVSSRLATGLYQRRQL